MNTITVTFKAEEKYKRVMGLWQWDYGRQVKICGLHPCDKTIEVHFSVAGNENSLTVEGKVSEEYIVAKIPDILLQNGRNLRAFVYVADLESGHTVREMELVVNKRPKPQDYEDPDGMFDEILEQLNKKGDELQLDGKELQLLSRKNLISSVMLPESECVEVGAITNEEIDEIMKGVE